MPGLDGLRALAVLAVIAYHLNLSWAPGGLLGVGVFFVLSGYLITDLLITKWDHSQRLDLKDFWISRVRRLLPALLIMIVIVVAWVTIFDRSYLGKLRGDVVASILYVSNWWNIFHHVSYFESFGPPSPIGNLWSLAVEEQFYLIWPILLYLGIRYIPRKRILVGLVLAGAAVSALAMDFIYQPGTDPSRVYYGTDTRVFSMLIGAGLALLWPSRKHSVQVPEKARLMLDLLGTTGLIGVLLMVGLTNQYDSFLYRGGMVLLSLFSAMLVAVLAHPASLIGKILGWGPLRWLGERSYGIYLWHYPVIILTSPTVDTGEPNILREVIQIAASIGIAALSWKYIENPIRHGAIKKMVSKVRNKEYRWSQLSMKRRAVLGFTLLLIAVFCVGMSPIVPAESVQEHALVKSNDKSVKITKSTEIDSDKRFDKSSEKKGIEHDSDANKKNQPKKQDESPGPVKEKKQPASASYSGQDITAIGDSVLVDAAPYLNKLLPGITVDARIGRQMSEASGVIKGLKSKGKLGNCVVIELGTNGPFTKKQLTSLLDTIGKDKKIVLVNTRVPRPWEKVVNSTLKEVASEFPNTTLVDWYAASAGKNSYFSPDGVHLNPKGAKNYASLIVRHLTHK